MRPLTTLYVYLWLAELHQLQNVSFQAEVFGSGISEDVNEGPGQGNLQGFLYGSYTHLRAVAPTLGGRITHEQTPMEEIISKCLILYFTRADFMLENQCNFFKNNFPFLMKQVM